MNIPGNDTEAESQILIDFAIVDISIARVTALNAATERLVKAKLIVHHVELGAPIKFTKTGLKECINQPFGDFRDKLKLIYDGLEVALRLAKYHSHEPRDPNHGKPHVISYHYFETTIAGKPAFFNVQLTNQGDYYLYSITDRVRDNKKSAQRA